jgi:hypothetical protein
LVIPLDLVFKYVVLIVIVLIIVLQFTI